MDDLKSQLHSRYGAATEIGGGRSADDPLVIHSIQVGDRNQGNGTKAMQAIADYADAHGLKVALTPDDMYGSSVPRLTRFYRRFGFVPNKGRNRDFSTRESMIRPPRPAIEHSPTPEPAPSDPAPRTGSDTVTDLLAASADTATYLSNLTGDNPIDRNYALSRAAEAFSDASTDPAITPEQRDHLAERLRALTAHEATRHSQFIRAGTSSLMPEDVLEANRIQDEAQTQAAQTVTGMERRNELLRHSNPERLTRYTLGVHKLIEPAHTAISTGDSDAAHGHVAQIRRLSDQMDAAGAHAHARWARGVADYAASKLEPATEYRPTPTNPAPEDDHPGARLISTAGLVRYLHDHYHVSSQFEGGSGPSNPLYLANIVVHGERNSGAGTKAMQTVVDFADAHGLKVGLDPGDAFGSSVPRLRQFYGRFGFEPNTGANRDRKTKGKMIRSPKAPDSVSDLPTPAPDTSYRMSHRAPHRTGEDEVDASDVTMAMPDFYEHPEYYTSGSHDPVDRLADKQSLTALRAVRGNPDAMITVYRAVPPGVTTVNPGDWVSTSKAYASRHGFGNDDPEKDWPVISRQVRAGDLLTDGNSINEWGWNPNPA